MKTIVRLSGGLGNQLFKFSHGLNYLHGDKDRLVFDVSWFGNQKILVGGTSERNFELLKFPKLNDFVFKEFGPEIFHGLTGRIQRNMGTSLQRLFRIQTDDNYGLVKKPRIIDGSFEDILHLPDIKLLADLLSFPENKSFELSNLLLENSESRPIAVHIRRTDYLNFRGIYDVLSIDYYLRAIESIRGDIGNQPLWLFSDDPESALKWVDNKILFSKIISNKLLQDPVEVMDLMAQSSAIVGANSTFAWWASFFASIRNKSIQIVLPNKFSTLEDDNPELKLKFKNWKMISSN